MEESSIKMHRWLYPASWLYGAGATLQNKFFDQEKPQSKSFNVLIIYIGNIAVGGTGKTPRAEYLAKLLHNKFQVAVLNWGCKRHIRGFVLSTAESDTRSVDGEPYQIQSKFSDIQVVVDEGRYHDIERLLVLKEPPVEVTSLDNASQHRYVRARLNILLADYHRLSCDDTLILAGRSRESAQGKNRVQIVIVTGYSPGIRPIDYNIITKRLNLSPCQQLYFSSFRCGNLWAIFPDSATVQERKLSSLQAEGQVLLITSVASPDMIVRELEIRTRNINLLAFSDHHDSD